MSPRLRAAAGGVLIGVGFALMMSAADQLKGPCEDCDDDAVESVEKVAQASAEMVTGALDEAVQAVSD